VLQDLTGDAGAKESRVHTRIVNTESEGIKQHEIITIRGNRVKVLMKTDGGLWPNHRSSR